MNITPLWIAIAILALNVIFLFFLLRRNHCPITYILVTPEHLPEKRVITPDELRETAWDSWNSAHPDASDIEQRQAYWAIEKEVRKLERKNRQQNPFADTQKPTRG